MRILLMNERYNSGGSEIQTHREKALLESRGHQVLLITLDKAVPHGWADEGRTHFNYGIKYNPVEDTCYRMAVDKLLSEALQRRINRFDPDCVHLNYFRAKAPTVYTALGELGYPVLQTIRDYAAVCPTGMCVDRRDEPCPGYLWEYCLKRCLPPTPKDQGRFLVKYQNLQVSNRLRLGAVTRFACPSQALTSCCNRHGLPTTCLNNPFDFSLLEHFQKRLEPGPMLYFYYGTVARNKGVAHLIQAFTQFAKGKNVRLYIAGAVRPEFKAEFQDLSTQPGIEYLGKLPYENVLWLLEKIHVVVAPSLWMENYPNTVLEGIATRCIVLSSDRGGGREMIRDDRFIFDVLNRQDIIAKLEAAYNLPPHRREAITAAAYDRIRHDNSMGVYYERLMGLLEECMAQEGAASI